MAGLRGRPSGREALAGVGGAVGVGREVERFDEAVPQALNGVGRIGFERVDHEAAMIAA